MPFPDIEDILCQLLERFGTTGTDTPADLADRLPFHRVSRYGGPDNGITDLAAIDIDTFAARRSDAFRLSNEVRDFLTRGPHQLGPFVLDGITCDTGPRRLPWTNTNVRRIGASFTVSARR